MLFQNKRTSKLSKLAITNLSLGIINITIGLILVFGFIYILCVVKTGPNNKSLMLANLVTSAKILLLLQIPSLILIICINSKSSFKRSFKILCVMPVIMGLIPSLLFISWENIAIYSARAMEKRTNPLYASGLYDAIRSGDEKKVKELLHAKPMLLTETLAHSEQPLAIAAKYGQKSIVKILLELGANVNDVDIYERTPLHWAASSGHEEIARMLITHGARVNRGDYQNRTALAYASEKGHIAIVKILEAQGGIHEDTNRLLAHAAASGDLDTVIRCLKIGVDFNSPDSPAFTALKEPAKKGHLEIAKCLIKNGANPNAVLKFWPEPPLFGAALYGNAEMVELLIQNGADVNYKNDIGKTPIECAVRGGNIQIVKLLLAKGADPNVKDFRGRTLLRLAEIDGHQDIVRLLSTQSLPKDSSSK